MKNKLKKSLLKIIVALALGISLCPVGGLMEPVTVYAGGEEETVGKKDVNLNISIDKEGKLHNGLNNANSTKAFNTIFQRFKVYILAFSGLATLIFVALGIKQSIAIGASAGNPSERTKAIHGLGWLLVATALCGSITLVVALAWNFGK